MGIFKIILITTLIIFGLIIIFSLINKAIQKKKDEKLLSEYQDKVVITKNGLSILSEGNGKHTLVFLSGGGTVSPIYDFKSLYTLLENDYKVIVVEKKGYGFSITDNSSRNIENMLSETRIALKELNIVEPYILVPHSMSGLEAIYWAQEYPEEIEAIIGLDMATPEAYLHMSLPNKFSTGILALLRNIGIYRIFPTIVDSNSPAINVGDLTKNNKEIYRALFHQKFMSQNFVNEIQNIHENVAIITQNSIPNVKTLLLISNGKGTGFNENDWKTFQHNYSVEIEHVEIEYYNCPHYLHNYEYVDISERIKEYIKEKL